jgi:hypothetical protein
MTKMRKPAEAKGCQPVTNKKHIGVHILFQNTLLTDNAALMMMLSNIL